MKTNMIDLIKRKIPQDQKQNYMDATSLDSVRNAYLQGQDRLSLNPSTDNSMSFIDKTDILGKLFPTTQNPGTQTQNNIANKIPEIVLPVQPEQTVQPDGNTYVESDAVKAAKDALAQQMAQKPGAYKSQWQNSLDEAMDKILNREKFEYDLNGDMLYQQYKDQYVNQGRQAMMDAMGRASALTGGFGNSWAQSAGQQTFQGYFQQLNDKIPELYQLALDRYNMDGEQLMDQLAILLEREGMDYDRYRDQMSDFLTERGYLTDRYDTERNYDYNIFTDNRDFNYQVNRDKVADEQWQKEFDEAIRQYLASADPEVRAAYNALGIGTGGTGDSVTGDGLTGGISTGNPFLDMIIGNMSSGSGNSGKGGGKLGGSNTTSLYYEGSKKPTSSTKGDIVDQVIRGDFGNGQARKDALKKAGYSDAEIKQIQAEVNKRMAGVTADDDDTVVPPGSMKSMFEQATGSTRYDNTGTKFTSEEYKAFEIEVGMNRTAGGKATTIVDALVEGKITEKQADELQKKYNLTDAEIEKALGMGN